MREADEENVRRTTVFVDTRTGACKQARDNVLPLKSDVLLEQDIVADLFDLCRDAHPGRTAAQEITVFKLVATTIRDMAAAEFLVAQDPS
jgi:alanine dehydrogenase